MVLAEVGVPEPDKAAGPAWAVGDEDSLEAMVSPVVSPEVRLEVAVAGDEDRLVRDVSRVDTEVSTSNFVHCLLCPRFVKGYSPKY